MHANCMQNATSWSIFFQRVGVCFRVHRRIFWFFFVSAYFRYSAHFRALRRVLEWLNLNHFILFYFTGNWIKIINDCLLNLKWCWASGKWKLGNKKSNIIWRCQNSIDNFSQFYYYYYYEILNDERVRVTEVVMRLTRLLVILHQTQNK